MHNFWKIHDTYISKIEQPIPISMVEKHEVESSEQEAYFDYLDDNLMNQICDHLLQQHRYHDLSLLIRASRRFLDLFQKKLTEIHNLSLLKPLLAEFTWDPYLIQDLCRQLIHDGRYRDVKALMQTNHYIYGICHRLMEEERVRLGH